MSGNEVEQVEGKVVDQQSGEVISEPEHGNLPAEQMHHADALQQFSEGVDVGIQRAQEIATKLRDIIDQQGLAVNIGGGGEHLRVEAWTSCGSLVGITPRTECTREVRNPQSGDLEGYEARVQAVRLATGEIVGAAESGCYYDEKMGGKQRWNERHSVLSMAQTRATSKVMSQCLRWVVTLAGYSGTPLEEMPADKGEPQQPQRSKPSQPRQQQSQPAAKTDENGGSWVTTTIEEAEEKESSNGIYYRIKSGRGKWASCFHENTGEELHKLAGTGQEVDIYVLKVQKGEKTFINIEDAVLDGEHLSEKHQREQAEDDGQGEPEPGGEDPDFQ